MRKVTYILTGTLLVLSVGGYLLPETPEPFPNRILMKNAAGYQGTVGKPEISEAQKRLFVL